MKYSTLFLILMFFSCQDAGNRTNEKDNLPEALTENKSESKGVSFSRKYEYNLVEEMFQELLDKQPEYRAIQVTIEGTGKMQSDSLKTFNDYKNKSELYYNSAAEIAAALSDTIVKQRINTILNSSKLSYKSLTANANNVVERIKQNEALSKDLYDALKITSTIKQIEIYQKTHLDTRAMIALIKQQELLIKKLETEIQKNEH